MHVAVSHGTLARRQQTARRVSLAMAMKEGVSKANTALHQCRLRRRPRRRRQHQQLGREHRRAVGCRVFCQCRAECADRAPATCQLAPLSRCVCRGARVQARASAPRRHRPRPSPPAIVAAADGLLRRRGLVSWVLVSVARRGAGKGKKRAITARPPLFFCCSLVPIYIRAALAHLWLPAAKAVSCHFAAAQRVLRLTHWGRAPLLPLEAGI